MHKKLDKYTEEILAGFCWIAGLFTSAKNAARLPKRGGPRQAGSLEARKTTTTQPSPRNFLLGLKDQKQSSGGISSLLIASGSWGNKQGGATYIL